ncbi:amino acid-binding protein [Tannerella sp.]|uniref:amino acid-binding protein n=1 Tax=Tannerella sp. TaxID=2382127 RepID=UPI0026DD99CE|nr:amino acid-binding protein [Tannerella sp.]MDO4703166.1 amino acid-binding protein [Tannerella sp.]
MLIRQLSVFLENKQGRFTQVAKLLGQEGINMTAFSVSENADFGILRLIVDDPDRAFEVLRRHKYAVTEVDVLRLCCPNRPGALGRLMDIVTQAGIFIEYMYAFSGERSGHVIIRPDNLEECVEVLNEHQSELTSISELYEL